MIAAISLMRRREDQGINAFRRHWLDVHGPLVCGFPALRHYVQLHVLESPATNALARRLQIDGFPILEFDNEEHRIRAHSSPEMTACNLDSLDFIGAVARVISERIDVMAPDDAGRARLMVLSPSGTPEGMMEEGMAQLRAMPRIRGLCRYHVLQQGRAPASVILHLAVEVEAVAQAWFDSFVDLECAAATIGNSAVACFAVEEHRLV
jgi:uncharacterized protein (TIGR02118 family)